MDTLQIFNSLLPINAKGKGKVYLYIHNRERLSSVIEEKNILLDLSACDT